jgi:heptosyltransferase-2
MLLLTLDSGPRHFAVALNRPVVVLMGSNDPRYAESEYEIGKVIREDVDCSPCQLKTCPTDRRCMTRISPEKVVETCIEVLNSEKNKTRLPLNHFINILNLSSSCLNVYG